MKKSLLVNVTVLVDEAHKDSLMVVGNDLKDKGFMLKESLEGIGVLIGSVRSSALAGLSSVPGVSAVEIERTDYRTQI